jgi:hypothetical protein
LRLRAQRRAHPEKNAARRAVNNALRSGTLERGTLCEVCDSNKKPHAHHPDYNQPLHVWWLCSGCHSTIHRLQREMLRRKRGFAKDGVTSTL